MNFERTLGWRILFAGLVLACRTATLWAAEEKAAPQNPEPKPDAGVTVDWSALKEFSAAATPRVPVPAALDPKYTAEGLTEAFRALANRLGYRVQRLSIDQTEFPFLVHGVIEGRCDYRQLRRGLEDMPGYAYSGSTTWITARTTEFALNMHPATAYPPEHAAAIRKRLAERLKALMNIPRRGP